MADRLTRRERKAMKPPAPLTDAERYALQEHFAPVWPAKATPVARPAPAPAGPSARPVPPPSTPLTYPRLTRAVADALAARGPGPA